MFSAAARPGAVIDEKGKIEAGSIFHRLTFAGSGQFFGLVIKTVAVVQIDDTAVDDPVAERFNISADGETA